MARQKGNTINASVPAASLVVDNTDPQTPTVVVDPPAPVKRLDTQVLMQLGQTFKALFDRYAADRLPVEQKWLKNLRQYLGIYDPDVEKQLPANRSRAYPRLTRIKCISMLSRLMNLMFPGNERNWELNASPSPEMPPELVAQAVQALLTQMQAESQGQPVQLTQDMVDAAVRDLADKQAEALTTLIDDQLVELGGNQTLDWIALNRKVVDSGIKYGIGVLEGPYVRTIQQSGWALVAPGQAGGQPQFQPQTRTIYKPMFEHLSCWDFYPDMSARSIPGEGYFVRKVMGRAAFRRLADRPDFFGEQVKRVINMLPSGNYRQKSWETELKAMGTAIQAETTRAGSQGREKYEVIIWKGPVSAQTLVEAGADVPDSMRADDIDAELWLVDNYVIKAEINAWRKMGVTVPQAHVFSFDEDDTSAIGQGLPGIMRDSQLAVCATTRMTLDNASIVCGPNMEVNLSLLTPDQDRGSIEPWKVWYRDDDNAMSAQFPAVREININGHLGELESLIKLFMDFADLETFIGPQTGGDMSKMPSEPMRTAAGASMLRGDAALPFKDIVRNYDSFTQSVIWSMVVFNKKFNPDEAPEGDYDVIPRGATSLIAKEVRGAQIDQLSATLTADEMDHVNQRKLVEAKFASRDLQGMLVSEDEAKQRASARAAVAAQDRQMQQDALQATIRETASKAFKNVTQGQKNDAASKDTSVKTALSMIEAGNGNDEGTSGGAAGPSGGGG